MSVILDLLGGISGLVTARLGLLSAVFVALGMRERRKRKEAEREAQTHKEMRKHEHDASIQSDEHLADRITRGR